MKKLLAGLLVMLLVLVGCGSKDSGNDGDTTTGKTYKIGTAVLTHESGKDVGEDDGQFKVDTYFAHVVLDGDTIVDVYIDVAQNTVKFDATGALTSFSAAGGKGTKKELGDDYNMVTYAGAVQEWYKQMESLEQWIEGKTLQEFLDMPVFQRDDAHPSVPDVEDLKSSVTITVENYQEVVKMAVENAVEVKDVVSVGTKSITSASEEGLEMNTYISTVALNSEGKVAHVFIDTMQSKAEAVDGVITLGGNTLTKKQLGADYGMAVYNPSAVAEWDVQIGSFEEYLVGQTVAEVVAMPLADGKADVEDLKSSVTITVSPYLEIFKKAADSAEAIK